MNLIRFCMASLALLTATSVKAQCEGWLPTGGAPGVTGTVRAIALWDADGPGPEPSRPVIGGMFTLHGEVHTNLARWNGQRWASMGTQSAGLSIQSLAVYNGDLIVGGIFSNMPGNIPAKNIARWNGQVWSPLGQGVDGEAKCMLVHNGELVVGGTFSTAGGAQATRVARWNGTQWFPFGTTPPAQIGGVVETLDIYQGEVVIGGFFSSQHCGNLGRWNGSSWQPLGGHPNFGVHAIAANGADLYAAGSFSTIGTNTFPQIARWDGTQWHPLGDGLNSIVRALELHGNELIAAGGFEFSGLTPVARIAKWNGVSWSGLEAGIPTAPLGAYTTVHALASNGGELLVGGLFLAAGDRGVNSIAMWNGNWNTLGHGADNDVRAVVEYNGSLVVGGAFRVIGGTLADRVARWNGSNWSPLDTGMNDTVYALAVHNGRLFAGGRFTTASGHAAAGMAEWNGAGWQPLANGLGIAVNTLISHDGRLVAGGSFNPATGGAENFVAAWNGTSWQSLGTGLGSTVNSLAEWNGRLVAGGSFTTGGGSSLRRVAQWDGVSWTQVGNGLPGTVYAVGTRDGSLYAGGSFESSSLDHIARLERDLWKPLPIAPNDTVYCLAGGVDGLLIGGSFRTAGPARSALAATWNGYTWRGLPMMIPNNTMNIRAMAPFQGEIVAGGHFARNQGYFARWSSSGVPWFAVQPQSGTFSQGSTMVLSVRPASGYSTAFFQWLRNGQLIANGPAGASSSGGIVAGATDSTLIVSDVQLSDAGQYSCRVTNSCGTVTSSFAAVQVLAACYPNCDGSTVAPVLNIQDFACFLNAFAAADPYANCDGSTTAPVLNVQDFGCFLNSFAAGCP